MEAKAKYKAKTKLYPFEGFLHDFPTSVLVEATLDAQHSALVAIEGMEKNAVRVELFWVTYNFEFREQIERWTRDNA